MPKLKNHCSYTTLEILLVIILLAVFVAIVLPRFGAGDLLNKQSLRAIAYNIASDIRATRQLAMTNAQAWTYSIQFDFAQKQYSIIAPDKTIETKTIPSAVTASGTPRYDFSSLGATATGTINLTIASGESWTVTVNGPTGTVRIQKP
jgi:Tfp pilus assembly protein FimT